MRLAALTLFPDWFVGPFGESILARAEARGLVDLRAFDLRPYGIGRHQVVDDAPYGGGGGMLLKPEPLAAALDAIAGPPGAEGRARVLLTSPRGRTWDHAAAIEAATAGRDIVIVCGRYEGVDERVIETRVDEEVSIGDFVLTGGEIAAMAIIDSIVRLMPGVLGNDTSAANDSFFDGLLEGPHYTRPEEFEGRRVPDVLLSGNHAAIAAWRREQAIAITRARRPELLAAWEARQPPPKEKKRRRPKKPDEGGSIGE